MVVNISKDKLTHFNFPDSLEQVLLTFRTTWQRFLPAIALLLFSSHSPFPVSLPRRIYAVGDRRGSEINQCPWQKRYQKCPRYLYGKGQKKHHWDRCIRPNLTPLVEQILTSGILKQTQQCFERTFLKRTQ